MERQRETLQSVLAVTSSQVQTILAESIQDTRKIEKIVSKNTLSSLVYHEPVILIDKKNKRYAFAAVGTAGVCLPLRNATSRATTILYKDIHSISLIHGDVPPFLERELAEHSQHIRIEMIDRRAGIIDFFTYEKQKIGYLFGMTQQLHFEDRQFSPLADRDDARGTDIAHSVERFLSAAKPDRGSSDSRRVVETLRDISYLLQQSRVALSEWLDHREAWQRMRDLARAVVPLRRDRAHKERSAVAAATAVATALASTISLCASVRQTISVLHSDHPFLDIVSSLISSAIHEERELRFRTEGPEDMEVVESAPWHEPGGVLAHSAVLGQDKHGAEMDVVVSFDDAVIRLLVAIFRFVRVGHLHGIRGVEARHCAGALVRERSGPAILTRAFSRMCHFMYAYPSVQEPLICVSETRGTAFPNDTLFTYAQFFGEVTCIRMAIDMILDRANEEVRCEMGQQIHQLEQQRSLYPVLATPG